ncbi:MAG: 2,3,4,5-tetrahydropyridine-2,6-dicarboxylate N-succinyltransferase [Pseudomonadota bacterium]
MAAYAYGIGIGTRNKKGEWLEVFFPQPRLAPNDAIASCLASEVTNSEAVLDSSALKALREALAGNGAEDDAALLAKLETQSDAHAGADEAGGEQALVVVYLTEDAAPANVPEAYLKLHLLSHRLVKPHETNLDGVFGVLPNVAWTNEGAIAIEELTERALDARLQGRHLEVSCVDKFPKMTNYVVPSGVRIADTARVRLGAHVGPGTTVMHEGFINFNAGTLGTGMIEGRISAGVVVGVDSDLGGGSSTMGTLSGGGNIIISVGEQCLIGANAGVGIPLGDRCTIESGLYVTAGTKVSVLDADGASTEVVAARVLAGESDLLFRRNSQSGAVECLTNKTAIQLNDALHAHN